MTGGDEGDVLRIVYLSAAAGEPDDADLAALLEVSRRNNARDGITGALAYHDGGFLHVLEGPEAAVAAAFARIACDPRHRRVVVCERATVGGRLFAGWSMGWSRPADLARAGLDPGVLRLGGTGSGVVDAMLAAFRRTVRLDP